MTHTDFSRKPLRKHYCVRGGAAAAMLLPVLYLPQAASAKTETGQMSLSAVVSAYCDIVALPAIGFGSISSTRENRSSSNSMVLNCSTGTPYTIYIGDGGARLGGNTNTLRGMRNLANPAQIQRYQIYKPGALYSQVWESRERGAGESGGYQSTGTGANQSIPIVAAIPAGTVLARAGAYSDTLTVTIAW
ncbi:Csu type fimbrial protein [Sphingomonas fennica]|uniref:Spore coat protein U/FanG domain-containing protein n=1 Tax=Edaphosphingomonas fennica TaxID=114404 RepID=A0A2T4I5I0_9SPHN|nr:spore coat U domain-containing protein [Sphingomonas fennica]PTD25472.1 hypothetical protein CV103_05715 [Sphingomonas fennica]